ncbi:MAG: hypothetical protein AAF960_19820, partial [Bacteroidota bacterium]
MSRWRTLWPFVLAYVVLTWLVADHPFFWDTVQLASKHAHWFYEQSFSTILLPDSIDSGHPPLFGIYLAFCWFLFGKTLLVSHFSMLPFLLGSLSFLYQLGIYFGQKENVTFLLLLGTLDPFVAGQSVLVSPDLVLLFAFLWMLTAILKEQKWAILLASLLLGLISMRGMMLCLALYGWWLTLPYFTCKKQFSVPQFLKDSSNKVVPFLPAGLLALAFLLYHYFEKGWVGYHPDSPWSGSFEQVNILGVLENIGILGWRLLDYGRLFLWMGLLFLLVKRFWKKIEVNQKSKYHLLENFWQLPSLILWLCLFLLPSLLLHKGLMNHRYLLPITVSLSLFFYQLWCQASWKKS